MLSNIVFTVLGKKIKRKKNTFIKVQLDDYEPVNMIFLTERETINCIEFFGPGIVTCIQSI